MTKNPSDQITSDARNHLLDDGYVVLRAFFDPHPLQVECERALVEGVGPVRQAQRFPAGTGTVTLQYVPMMCERTPASLNLVMVLAGVAEKLLQRPVLPGRAKGTRYLGDTGWHRDSESDMVTLGCVAYLDSLTARAGALCVLPGSHLDRGLGVRDTALESPVALETNPGDLIIFDERLTHGSGGGTERLQWRTDFAPDPMGSEVAAVRNWFRNALPDETRSVGYDAQLYPSYGAHWRARHPHWAGRLDQIIDLPGWTCR